MTGQATCIRLHPDWRPDVDYGRGGPCPAFEVIVPVAMVPLRHDPPGWEPGGSVMLPAGTRLRFIGASFRHGYPPWDFSAYVFQVETPAGLGSCYEVETQDAADDAGFWTTLRLIK